VIRRTYLGLDIGSVELRGVALRRQGRGVMLDGGRFLPMKEGVVVPDLRETNIRDPHRFREYVREVLNPLAGTEERIALSLPTGSGRVMVREFESPFRSHQEGIDVIKWQLKKSLPVEARELQLDYQVLGRGDSGRTRVLISMVGQTVLRQYEDELAEAGYGAEQVDFQPLNLYTFHRPRLETGSDFLLVGIDQDSLLLLYCQDRSLVYHRAREITRDAQAVFQEISRTLAGLPDNLAGVHRAPVFLHCDWPDAAEVHAAVASACERDVVLLDPNARRLTQEPLDFPDWRYRTLAVAIGAAERLM
jgi:type IV pilus assembly protein PilM